METDILISPFLGKDTKFIIHKVHTLVIGSGAAGLPPHRQPQADYSDRRRGSG